MTLFYCCSLEQVATTDRTKAAMFPCERELSEGVSKRYGVVSGSLARSLCLWGRFGALAREEIYAICTVSESENGQRRESLGVRRSHMCIQICFYIFERKRNN